MKIIKRIAEEQFCFTELHFDSIKEYEDLYPEFAEVMARVKRECKKAVEEAPKFDEVRHNSIPLEDIKTPY